jgi:hypothetical protein
LSSGRKKVTVLALTCRDCCDPVGRVVLDRSGIAAISGFQVDGRMQDRVRIVLPPWERDRVRHAIRKGAAALNAIDERYVPPFCPSATRRTASAVAASTRHRARRVLAGTAGG